MAFAHVQASATGTILSTATPATTLNVSFGSAISSGSLVAGGVTWDRTTSQALSSVVDDKGNTYTVEQVNDTTNNQGAASFFRGNITNGPITLTFTWASATETVTVIADEYSGGLAATDPRDGHQGNFQPTPGTGTNAVTSGTAITTTANGDLIYGVGFQTGAIAGTINAGTTPAYTSRGAVSALANAVSGRSEDLVQGSAGSAQTTFTNLAASATVAFIVAFQPPAAVVVAPTPRMGAISI